VHMLLMSYAGEQAQEDLIASIGLDMDRDILTKRSIITSQSLADQWRQLVLGPLLKLDGSDTYLSYVVVLDALDEYGGENDVKIILRPLG
jgi:hypothetical protein